MFVEIELFRFERSEMKARSGCSSRFQDNGRTKEQNLKKAPKINYSRILPTSVMFVTGLQVTTLYFL